MAHLLAQILLVVCVVVSHVVVPELAVLKHQLLLELHEEPVVALLEGLELGYCVLRLEGVEFLAVEHLDSPSDVFTHHVLGLSSDGARGSGPALRLVVLLANARTHEVGRLAAVRVLNLQTVHFAIVTATP